MCFMLTACGLNSWNVKVGFDCYEILFGFLRRFCCLYACFAGLRVSNCN